MHKIKSIKAMENKFKKSRLVNQASMIKSFIRPISCETILSLRQLAKEKRDNRNFVFHNLIQIISNKDTLLLAYQLIKSTFGIIASLNAGWVEKTSQRLKAGKFVFTTLKNGLVPKDEQIVQKAISLVLETIYEPIFSPHSHGSRRGKGNHTALKEIKTSFSEAVWIIQANTSKCFDCIDHKILLTLLKKKIKCDKTIALIKSSLSCGYIFEKTGTYRPKVGFVTDFVLGPILSNIYLDEVDQILTQQQKSFNSIVKKRLRNPVIKTLTYKLNKKFTTKGERQTIRLEIAKCYRSLNINYKRLFFVRYLEYFFIGIVGHYRDAVLFRDQIKKFLLDSLKLELNMTKIINFSTNKVFFLGVFIRRAYRKEKIVIKDVRKDKFRTPKSTHRVSFYAPIKSLFESFTKKGFFKRKQSKFIAKSVKTLSNFEHGSILRYYNSIIYGILNYFSFVDNKKSLGSLIHNLKMSAARTLALKYKKRAIKPVFIEYGKLLSCPRTGVSLNIPKISVRDKLFLIDVRMVEDVIKENNLKSLCYTTNCKVDGKPNELKGSRSVWEEVPKNPNIY
jgi:retron-type reverse transcriptase